jgi:hypothetical protein
MAAPAVQDVRRAFVVATLAGAIAPPGQRVRRPAGAVRGGRPGGSTCQCIAVQAAPWNFPQAGCARRTSPCARATAPRPVLQDAYALHLARDDSGAIAAFLDDPAVRVLAVSCEGSGRDRTHQPVLPTDASLQRTKAWLLEQRLQHARSRGAPSTLPMLPGERGARLGGQAAGAAGQQHRLPERLPIPGGPVAAWGGTVDCWAGYFQKARSSCSCTCSCSRTRARIMHATPALHPARSR